MTAKGVEKRSLTTQRPRLLRRELCMLLQCLVLQLGFLPLCGLRAGDNLLRCKVVPLLEAPS
jgi:hypothetical protein